LITGATTQLRGKQKKKAAGGVWFGELLRRKPATVATVALANKMADVAWTVLTKATFY
jgi:transposase